MLRLRKDSVRVALSQSCQVEGHEVETTGKEAAAEHKAPIVLMKQNTSKLRHLNTSAAGASLNKSEETGEHAMAFYTEC